MDAQRFLSLTGARFFTGVPDSLLRPFLDTLMRLYPPDTAAHVIAANEGSAVALAAGHYLASGDVGLVYLQNSGMGHMLNPAVSLLHPKVYGIPVLFVIGWRGQPGVHDEPQHVYQGEITLKLLDDMQIPYSVVTRDTQPSDMEDTMRSFRASFAEGISCAFVVEKGALTQESPYPYTHPAPLSREHALEILTEYTGNAPIVSTTGKASRELFEIRERKGQGHGLDFLTVGSMGHASSIALGICLEKPDTRVYCVDGDGALLMHMGALVTIARTHPRNLTYILLNNASHDTVGGMPTAIETLACDRWAADLGFDRVCLCQDENALRQALAQKQEGLVFLECRVAGGARDNLGRPTTSPAENRDAFMRTLCHG
ncbi:MAG: phosphonopyruvate decarboxylase [Clostridia bacterium]|nr:phosphonopyruvate decarboxylase [Clostridia bacterium]